MIVAIAYSLTMGTDESLQDKFNKHHANNPCYEMPPTKEPVFSIVHYAGKVKYKIKVTVYLRIILLFKFKYTKK